MYYCNIFLLLLDLTFKSFKRNPQISVLSTDTDALMSQGISTLFIELEETLLANTISTLSFSSQEY